MGAGRSGTTLLDIILGNNPGIFSAGELNRFAKRRGIPVTTGGESETVAFWKKFRLLLPSAWQQDEFEDMKVICSSFEYHSAAIKMFLPFRDKARKQYAAILKTFFETLAPMVAEPVIVDSSKYPMRGYFMGEMLDYEMAYIYIKRNPLDVVKSFEKKDIEQPRKGWLMTNLYMMTVNFICLYVLKKVSKTHPSVTIRYDELVSSPVQTLETIGKKLQIDVSHAQKLIQQHEPFKPGLLFDGNRIRLEKEIILKSAKTIAKPEGIKDHLTMMLQHFWWN